METSHVIRGEEWLPSLPYIIYYTKPLVGMHPNLHLPLILKPIGNGKLSKRDGDKMGFSISFGMENRRRNFHRDIEKMDFSEAVINFLALLGWNEWNRTRDILVGRIGFKI